MRISGLTGYYAFLLVGSEDVMHIGTPVNACIHLLI